jgi:hypothetical protein
MARLGAGSQLEKGQQGWTLLARVLLVVLALQVLEHLQGGELLDYLHTIHHFSEHQAATLFRQVRKVAELWNG